MKIIGNEENVNIISLIHKGKDIKFQRISEPMPYMTPLNLEKDKRAEIVFNDLLEVDELISILKQFKEECGRYIGIWQRRVN